MSDENTLDKEIASWQGFQDYLMHDELERLFEKMLSEAKAYEPALRNLSSKEPDQVLFITLILRQQIIISYLEAEIAKLNGTK